jgi:ParB family chromosome partitioning protein
VAKQIILVNPFRCRLWDLHDRFEANISEETCRAEIDSFSRHGQIVPALGRPLRGNPDHDVEIICGARRLFVARHIKRDLTVELREISDREAFILMDTENRQRADISPYERGMSYARWLRSGHFESQDDIARALKISAAQVSRLLKLSRLPAVVVDAFASPTEIHESWGLDLIEALDDSERRGPTIRRARSLSLQTPRQKGADVYRQLLASTGRGRRSKASGHDEVVKDEDGLPLFRIRQLRSSIALLLPLEQVPAAVLADIREALATILSVGAAAASRSERTSRPAPRLVAVSSGGALQVSSAIGD